jgi:hypothetical protein
MRRTTCCLLAESHLTGRLFGGMLQRIVTLPSPRDRRLGAAQQTLVTRLGGGRSVSGIDWTNGISGGLRGCETLNRPLRCAAGGTLDQNWAKGLLREADLSMAESNRRGKTEIPALEAPGAD